MSTLTFIGAARTVTGSKHLLTTDNCKILIDCGLYQGLKALRLKNWDELPFDAASLDAVVLTHAHIDHTGFLPRLIVKGFKGKVYTTPATCDLASIMLPDSGRLQEEEAKYANKKGFSKHSPALPLYTELDAKRALSHLSPVPYDTPLKVAEGLVLTFRQAGHILGSALVEAEITGNKGRTKVLFSGDLGREHTPILQDPAIISDTDYLLLESTYGDRLHTVTDRKEALKKVVRETLSRRGSLPSPWSAPRRSSTS